MSTINPKAAFSTGDVMKRLAEHDDAIRALQTARRLESASIGAGGLRVFGGGSIRMTEGGDIVIEGGGQLRVVREDGPGIVVEGGGSVSVEDGGTIRARHSNGVNGTLFGSLADEATGLSAGHGLLVQDDSNADIFRARQDDEAGDLRVTIGAAVGQTLFPIDFFLGWSEVMNLITTESMTLSNTGSGALIVDNDGTGDASFRSSNANVFLSAENGISRVINNAECWFDHGTVVGETANCHITSEGLFREITSSREHKTDIENYTADPGEILKLAARTFRSKDEVEADPVTANCYLGLIAEEVDDLGLSEFVTYNEEGNPRGVAYDKVALGLLQVVKAQQVQIDALTEWAAKQGFAPTERSTVDRQQTVRAVPVHVDKPVPRQQANHADA